MRACSQYNQKSNPKRAFLNRNFSRPYLSQQMKPKKFKQNRYGPDILYSDVLGLSPRNAISLCKLSERSTILVLRRSVIHLKRAERFSSPCPLSIPAVLLLRVLKVTGAHACGYNIFSNAL